VAYRAYVTALVSVAAALGASSVIGDAPLTGDQVAWILDEAIAWAGLGVAVVVAAAVRTGGRGGPLAVEAADAHHILLAPVERGRALAPAAGMLVARWAGAGALVGAVTGELLAHRAPGGRATWLVPLAVAGAVVGVLAASAALLTAGRRPAAPLRVATATVVVGWAGLHVAEAVPGSPTALVGEVAVWGHQPSWGAGMAVAAVALLAVLGLRSVGGLSVEAARRRAVLVGQLRFALAQQDLRAVLLLRRRLALDGHRERPWFSLQAGWLGDRVPVAARDVCSLARWPLPRLLRLAGLGLLAGTATAGAWAGTTPLLAVTGGALFVAALDALEPMAQELDRPSRLSALAHPEGAVLARHLAVPFVVVLAVAGLAAGTALALQPDPDLAGVVLVALVPAAAAAVAGAAVGLASEPVLDRATEAALSPEVAGPRLAVRLGGPPAVAVFGQFPLLVAQQVVGQGFDPVAEARTAVVPVAVLAGLAVVWLRYRAELYRRLPGAAAGGP
jgi:hypothetical protein